MRLEFLVEGSADCPLIRIFSFTNAEVVRLKEISDRLAKGSEHEAALHQEPGVEPMGGCRLQLRVGNRDRGVIQQAPLQFECVLTTDGWTDLSWLLEPLCAREHSVGYQWLNGKGPISLLLSADGKW
jgi:hypothetical protein